MKKDDKAQMEIARFVLSEPRQRRGESKDPVEMFTRPDTGAAPEEFEDRGGLSAL